MNVVILAFGPSQTTAAAVRRARRMAGAASTIVAVAATPLGRPTATEPLGYAEGIGTPALTGALSSMTGPTLLIHDDAALQLRGLKVMAQESQAHRAIMVPGTNDIGSDHFVGSLPGSTAPDGALARHRSAHSGSELRTVIPTALFGDAEHLLELVDAKLVDPRTTLTLNTVRMIGSSVVATHDGTCRSRLEVPESSRPLLVASMIVKNEEDLLADCLASLTGLVDRIDICDTGSVDGTIEIAEAAGANVRRIEWRDDFAWARNQALEMSRDALFVLQIDADERVVCSDPAEFRSFLATYGHEYSGFQPRIVNIHDLETRAVASAFRATRIFTTTDSTFVGAIHEAPVIASQGEIAVPASPLDMLWLEHLGYAQHFVGLRDKAQRNVRIAGAELESNEGFRSLFHYARSLQLIDATDQRAAEYFERALAYEEDANLQTRAHTYGSVAHYRLLEGRNDDALQLARKGLEIVPADEMCALVAAKCLNAAGRPEEVLTLFEERASRPSVTPMFSTERNQYRLGSALVAAEAQLGDFESACLRAADILGNDAIAFEDWTAVALAAIRLGDPAVDVLASLAALDPTGQFDRVIATTVPPTMATRFAVRYFEAGGTITDVAATGLLTAMVADDDDAAETLAALARALPEATVRKLAQMADDRGFTNIVDILVEPAGV
jgi:glycosyltransferase involved in cell wall biosynthesis